MSSYWNETEFPGDLLSNYNFLIQLCKLSINIVFILKYPWYFLKYPWYFLKYLWYFELKWYARLNSNSRTSDPLVNVNSNLSLTASTLLHRLVLLSVCFIYPMSGRYSTNWDRKGWPGSEIQMYYGCPCFWHPLLNFSKNISIPLTIKIRGIKLAEISRFRMIGLV